MRRHLVWALVLALVLSFGYNYYQQVRFNRLYWFSGSKVTDRLIHGYIRIDELLAEPDSAKRSAALFAIQEAPAEIQTLGGNLDTMLTRVWPVPRPALGSVGHDLLMFTFGVWNRLHAHAAVFQSSTNDLPSPDDLSRLSRVYKIYAEHFPQGIVLSHNAARHREALKAVHEQIRREGLDDLLPDLVRDSVLNSPVN